MQILNNCQSLITNILTVRSEYVVKPLVSAVLRVWQRISSLFAPGVPQITMPTHPIANPYPRNYKTLPWPLYLDHAGSGYLLGDQTEKIPADKVNLPEPLERVTPLHVAAGSSQHTKGLFRLIAQGASVDAKDRRGQTPAYWAAYWGKAHALSILKIYGANLHQVDKRGKSLMRAAAKYNNTQVIDFLVSHKVSIQTQDGRGLTPLQVAAYMGNVQAYERLAYYGADENAKDRSGRTAREVLEQKCQEIYQNSWFFVRWFIRPEPQFTLLPYMRQQLTAMRPAQNSG